MSTDKKTILVADDDPGILDALQLMLENVGGYNVNTISDGHDLLDIQSQPDLILLDLWMSGINGKEICQHLKSDEKTKNIPVIIFSANKDIESIAHSCNADDFIAKPFQMKELLVKIEKLL